MKHYRNRKVQCT